MKKVLAILAAAAILCACGCGKQTAQNETATEPAAPVSVIAPELDDDLALPAVNESGSTTAPVAQQPASPAPITPAPTTAAPPTAASDTTAPAPTDPAAPPAPSETAPQPTATQAPPPTTEKPTETTTEAPKSAELLQSAVLAPINSGTYTMTVRAFLKDHSNDDTLSKYVRGGDTAYSLSVPSAKLTMRIFSADGKYYLIAANQFCELTKAQYDEICGPFSNYFPNFKSMKYQKTETGGSLLNRYTDEYFDVGGNTVVMRYEKGALSQIQSGGISLPFTVSSGADSAAFSVAPDMKQVEYAEMEFLAGLSQMF